MDKSCTATTFLITKTFAPLVKQYYINKKGQQHGPLTFEQIDFTTIEPDNDVWYEGLPQWIKAKDVVEFNEKLIKRNTPPPLNPTPPLLNSDKNFEELKFKCEWCNAKHDRNFIVCASCKKTRKDIWWDNTRGWWFLAMFIFCMIMMIVFVNILSPDPTADNAMTMIGATIAVSIVLAITGIIFLVLGIVYSNRAKKKMKLKDFD